MTPPNRPYPQILAVDEDGLTIGVRGAKALPGDPGEHRRRIVEGCNHAPRDRHSSERIVFRAVPLRAVGRGGGIVRIAQDARGIVEDHDRDAMLTTTPHASRRRVLRPVARRAEVTHASGDRRTWGRRRSGRRAAQVPKKNRSKASAPRGHPRLYLGATNLAAKRVRRAPSRGHLRPALVADRFAKCVPPFLGRRPHLVAYRYRCGSRVPGMARGSGRRGARESAGSARFGREPATHTGVASSRAGEGGRGVTVTTRSASTSAARSGSRARRVLAWRTRRTGGTSARCGCGRRLAERGFADLALRGGEHHLELLPMKKANSALQGFDPADASSCIPTREAREPYFGSVGRYWASQRQIGHDGVPETGWVPPTTHAPEGQAMPNRVLSGLSSCLNFLSSSFKKVPDTRTIEKLVDATATNSNRVRGSARIPDLHAGAV
jgi:hypothetical protein